MWCFASSKTCARRRARRQPLQTLAGFRKWRLLSSNLPLDQARPNRPTGAHLISRFGALGDSELELDTAVAGLDDLVDELARQVAAIAKREPGSVFDSHFDELA